MEKTLSELKETLWYFCESLLESMKNDKPKECISFISAFQNMQRLRQRLLSLDESSHIEFL